MTTKSKRPAGAAGRPGIPVDYENSPAVDPTDAVRELVLAGEKRQDDLRLLTKELYDSKNSCAKELSELRERYHEAIGRLREEHQAKMMAAEAGRLDSIRQVDREEVSKTAVAANTAITTLAKQTNDLATTLAKQVADTALAAEARNSAQYSDTNKRLSALELSSSEGKGKQTVADPAMDKLVLVVGELAKAQAMGSGKTQGSTAMWGYVAAGIAGLGFLISLAITIFFALRH